MHDLEMWWKIKLNLPVWLCSEQLNFPSKQKFKSSGSFGKKMSQATKSQVTLKGSSQMVAEFFNYGINSILYQRGVYPPGMISWKTLFVSSFQIWSWCFRLHTYLLKIFNRISESFTRKQEYGLTILVSSDEKVNAFLKNILSQIKDWYVHSSLLFLCKRKW